MATRVDITLDQGSTFEFSVDVQDINGEALDLSDYTITAQMRRHYTSTNSYSFTTDSANTNQAIISMTAIETALIPAGRYVYDVEIFNDSSNAVTRVVQGVVTVSPEVTR